MKKFKLCAVDMDGTLLRSDNTISNATVEAVRKMTDNGGYFCLTTGRPPIAVKGFYDMLRLSTPTIVYNGARIYDIARDRDYYSQNLEKNAAETVMRFVEQNNTTMCIWSQDRLYTNIYNSHSEEYRRISNADMQTVGSEQYGRLAENGVTKIVICDVHENICRLKESADSEMCGAVSVASSGPEYLEFFDRRVSKGVALAKLCDILGVDISETIAIGDNYNDSQMLKAAGLGVAMGNAPQDIKDICGEVTLSNDEDGVRSVLEKYFL